MKTKIFILLIQVLLGNNYIFQFNGLGDKCKTEFYSDKRICLNLWEDENT